MSLDAAVIARAPCSALLAAQAEARDQLFLANKRYREAVLAFLAKGANPIDRVARFLACGAAPRPLVPISSGHRGLHTADDGLPRRI